MSAFHTFADKSGENYEEVVYYVISERYILHPGGLNSGLQIHEGLTTLLYILGSIRLTSSQEFHHKPISERPKRL